MRRPSLGPVGRGFSISARVQAAEGSGDHGHEPPRPHDAGQVSLMSSGVSGGRDGVAGTRRPDAATEVENFFKEAG